MFKLLNKIYIIGALCMAATPVFAKVCFLPDAGDDCKKAHPLIKTNPVIQCEFKDEQTANSGLGECQEAYPSGFCFYRRCKKSETDCLKEAHEAVESWILAFKSGKDLPEKQKCVVCKDGCWKLEKSKYGPDTEHTCKDKGFKVKENCTAEHVRFKAIDLIDKNGNRCGVCENLACMEMGGLKTEGSCADDEEFVYADKMDGFGNKCGTCEPKTTPGCTVLKGNPPAGCSYELAYGNGSTFPTNGIKLDAGATTRIWANSRNNSLITDIIGFSGTSYADSNGRYKDLTCESGRTYTVSAICTTNSGDGGKQKCSDWNLKSSCDSGYTLLQSTEHPTDDYNHKCGTCSKTYIVDIKPFIVTVSEGCEVKTNVDLSTDSAAKNDSFIINNDVKLNGDVNVNIYKGKKYAELVTKYFPLRLGTETWYEADYPKIIDESVCKNFKTKYPEVTGLENTAKIYECVGIHSSTKIKIIANNKEYNFGTDKCVTFYIGNDNRTICYNYNNYSCNLE